MAKNIITIGREYGSGGYEIGQKIAGKMGYTFYDKELISDLADKIMVSPSFVEKNDENVKEQHLNIFQEIFPIFASNENEDVDYIFREQGKFIVQLAEKGNCVFVGRRADYYLKDNPDALHLFLYADMDFRIRRIADKYNLSDEKAVEKILDMDKRRRTSYEYTTGRKWGDFHNYDIMICTSTFGIDKCVEEIIGLLK
jgi:cytidylate kinase